MSDRSERLNFLLRRTTGEKLRSQYRIKLHDQIGNNACDLAFLELNESDIILERISHEFPNAIELKESWRKPDFEYEGGLTELINYLPVPSYESDVYVVPTEANCTGLIHASSKFVNTFWLQMLYVFKDFDVYDNILKMRLSFGLGDTLPDNSYQVNISCWGSEWERSLRLTVHRGTS